MRLPSLLCLLFAASSSALAQSMTSPAPAPAPAPSSASDGARDAWKTMSNYVLQTAEAVPEARYAYRPSGDVRTFHELFLHVAGAQAMFCAIAMGEKPPAENAIKATSKAEVVEALRKTNADCARAYAQSDADAAAVVEVFGAPHSRLYALTMNAVHDAEHYGNLVTYMRLIHIVPPSSRPRS